MIRYQKVDFKRVSQGLPELTRYFKEFQQQLVAVYLFGSMAAERVQPLSDVDIAVLFDHKLSAKQREDLEGQFYLEISKQLGTDEVDLVVLNEAPLSVQYGVVRERKLLYYRDKFEVIDFEEYVILNYLDFLPYREEFNREFLAGI